MIEEKLNLAFNIPLSQLEEKISSRLNGDLVGYEHVVPLRQMKEVSNICLMREEVLHALIRSVPLRRQEGDGLAVYPYANSDIRVFGREPKGLEIGQTFILDRKLLGLMAAFGGGLFSGFITKGLSKMPPVQVYGLDITGKKSMAFYIPPIVEIQGRDAVLVDGMHRSYLCNAAGTTINAVHINDVVAPLPFKPITWRDVSVVSEKPPKDKRYVNLDTKYFRDLTAVGIDG